MPNLFSPALVVAALQDGRLTVLAGRTRRELAWSTHPLDAPDAAARATLVSTLRELAPSGPWRPKARFHCSLPAQGIALRRIPLPQAEGAELHRLAQLQVEAAFPIPPDELAWGIVAPASRTDRSGPCPVTLAAIRRAALEPLAAAVAEAGLVPVFTLACRVRHNAALAGFTGARFDIGPLSTDFSLWENGDLIRIRTLAAGTSDVPAAAAALAEATASLPAGSRVSLGGLANAQEFEPFLARIPDRTRIEIRPGSELPLAEHPGEPLPLRLTLDASAAPPPGESARRIPAAAIPWLVRAGALALALVLFPYAEAFINRPRLQRQLDALVKDRARLGEIDRRLEFVQHLSDNQPPYLDATYVFANAAPPGTRIDSLTMNRRGEVSIAGAVQQPQQVGELRTRLVDSRFFSSVVVEEQAMGQPGGGRVTFRISAQWKAQAEREALQLGPEPPKPATTNGPQPSAPSPVPPNPLPK